MMNWVEAVAAMEGGAHVQRASEKGLKRIGEINGTPIYEGGMEPCFLAHAWTADEKPVKVFCGSGSGVLFVPESEHTDATDWVVVEQ